MTKMDGKAEVKGNAVATALFLLLMVPYLVILIVSWAVYAVLELLPIPRRAKDDREDGR